MIRIGMIGSNFGKVGLTPAFGSVKNCEVISLNTKDNWNKILNKKNLDAIALAVPPNIQYKIAKIAIKKGLHVFAEKPLTANLKQAQELLTLAQKHKVITGIDFIFPEIAEWRKVKELLEKEKFGKLKHISVNWQWLSSDIKYKRKSWKTNIKKGGGVLSFYFSHGLYYLENFAGKIKNIRTKLSYSKESKGSAEIGIDMEIKFENGATGDVHVFCNSRKFVKHKLVFECKKGTIVLENRNAVVDKFSINVHTEKDARQIKVKKNKNNKKEDERVKIVRILAKKFINSCISRKQMYPSFKEGLRVQELIELARKRKV